MATEDLVRRLDLNPYPVVLVPQKSIGEEAVVVWDAALVLAHFLLKHCQEFLNPKVHVLELGAGTGAVGLACSALG